MNLRDVYVVLVDRRGKPALFEAEDRNSHEHLSPYDHIEPGEGRGGLTNESWHLIDTDGKPTGAFAFSSLVPIDTGLVTVIGKNQLSLMDQIRKEAERMFPQVPAQKAG